jgi:hypothetical protein
MMSAVCLAAMGNKLALMGCSRHYWLRDSCIRPNLPFVLEDQFFLFAHAGALHGDSSTYPRPLGLHGIVWKGYVRIDEVIVVLLVGIYCSVIVVLVVVFSLLEHSSFVLQSCDTVAWK